jgi:hypothetical protein
VLDLGYGILKLMGTAIIQRYSYPLAQQLTNGQQHATNEQLSSKSKQAHKCYTTLLS